MMPTIVGRNDLPARAAVALESVVRRRIMRCGDHDARVAAEMKDRAGEQRRGAWLLDEIDLETGGREHARAELGKLGRVMPRVVGDHTRSR